MKTTLLTAVFFPAILSAQLLKGKVNDAETGDPVFGAKLFFSSGQKLLSDPNGEFRAEPVYFPLQIIYSAIGYETDTLLISDPVDFIAIALEPVVQTEESVVITAGRHQQDVTDVPVSMEILKPELYDNKGLTNVEQVVDQAPGAYAMDGQISIRGGSGFSYGAGSRVLLLSNGIPLLSADAGDAKWTSLPMESASQIEIIKGASSVLYGSGALNGIISLTEREPTPEGKLRVKVQSGLYDSPKRSSLKWWNTSPLFHQADVYYGKMYKRFGFTVAAYGFHNDGYREGETEDRARMSGTVFWKPQKISNLKAGVGYNLQYQKIGTFIIWQSDTFAYQPLGGADTSQAGSTLGISGGVRFNIDPYVKYIDKHKNIHELKTRYYLVQNNNYTNEDQSSKAYTYYADYQFQKRLSVWGRVTAGATATHNEVRSGLYGDHSSLNLAGYVQYEQKIGSRLDITGGLRFEYFEQDTIRGDSDFYLNSDSTKKIPVYPIARFGLHYQAAKFTHLRASFGQGIRYPTVAERFTQTAVGSLIIFPNPNLRPEIGWAAEIGVKQGVKLGKWMGYVDVAGFVNQYDNMMEFAFGNYKPDSIPGSLNPNAPGYILKWLGFRAQNAEKARIAGVEFSFNSQGKIGPVEVQSLIGYTYMDPVSLNTDSTYRQTFSDTNTNLLKYRFRHLAKADVQLTWKNFSLGGSMRYNSYMSNIDRIFEDEVLPGINIVPGLKQYRADHATGSLVFDMRIGYRFLDHYRVGFMINNIFNREYMGRPADIQPPRSFVAQVRLDF